MGDGTKKGNQETNQEAHECPVKVKGTCLPISQEGEMKKVQCPAHVTCEKEAVGKWPTQLCWGVTHGQSRRAVGLGSGVLPSPSAHRGSLLSLPAPFCLPGHILAPLCEELAGLRCPEATAPQPLASNLVCHEETRILATATPLPGHSSTATHVITHPQLQHHTSTHTRNHNTHTPADHNHPATSAPPATYQTVYCVPTEDPGRESPGLPLQAKQEVCLSSPALSHCAWCQELADLRGGTDQRAHRSRRSWNWNLDSSPWMLFPKNSARRRAAGRRGAESCLV
ncbi:uncharacterized protein LOC124075905 [Marmota monax]|uniref:uncharacterized protein LOC124075905 n=1 Tax=Marmota monax TaxID=9995 RepID=UPI001EB04997|nr:uncharacterized protein LOC124075905 [Marmota monax]